MQQLLTNIAKVAGVAAALASTHAAVAQTEHSDTADLHRAQGPLISRPLAPVESPPSAQQVGLQWGGIVVCLVSSAALSGATLGLFSLSKMQLTLLKSQGDIAAKKVLGLREDANTLLSTLVWANVASGVGLTVLTDRTLSGPAAILFSVGALTLLGEILPQAYFSRNALKMGAAMEPTVKVLGAVLYPIAKPCGLLLDKLVGKDGVSFHKEEELKDLLSLHASEPSELSTVEATGASNFLSLDDLKLAEIGEEIQGEEILFLAFSGDRPSLPQFELRRDDAFIRQIDQTGDRWCIVCDEQGRPKLALDADGFLRDALTEGRNVHPRSYWHRPIIITEEDATVGDVLPQLSVREGSEGNPELEHDAILFWSAGKKRLITGEHLFGLLLKGIARDSALTPATQRNDR